MNSPSKHITVPSFVGLFGSCLDLPRQIIGEPIYWRRNQPSLICHLTGAEIEVATKILAWLQFMGKDPNDGHNTSQRKYILVWQSEATIQTAPISLTPLYSLLASLSSGDSVSRQHYRSLLF
jgi:hypothetical protein